MRPVACGALLRMAPRDAPGIENECFAEQRSFRVMSEFENSHKLGFFFFMGGERREEKEIKFLKGLPLTMKWLVGRKH